MNKQGFTLVEILVAVLIVIVLVTMAAPMYEKAIEKSRIAEARATAKKLWDSKMRQLNSMDLEVYSSSDFGLENLDFSLPCETSSIHSGHRVTCKTADFSFRINPEASGSSSSAILNGICVYRLKGDQEGTTFLYVGDDASASEEEAYGKFWCHNNSSGSSCEAYGMTADPRKTWSCNE